MIYNCNRVSVIYRYVICHTWDIYLYVVYIYIYQRPLGRMVSHWWRSCRRKFWMKASAHLSTSWWIVGLLSSLLPFEGTVTDLLFSVMALALVPVVQCRESCCKELIFPDDVYVFWSICGWWWVLDFGVVCIYRIICIFYMPKCFLSPRNNFEFLEGITNKRWKFGLYV